MIENPSLHNSTHESRLFELRTLCCDKYDDLNIDTWHTSYENGAHRKTDWAHVLSLCYSSRRAFSSVRFNFVLISVAQVCLFCFATNPYLVIEKTLTLDLYRTYIEYLLFERWKVDRLTC